MLNSLLVEHMIRILPILFALTILSCGSDASDADVIKTTPRFTLEVQEAFTVVKDGVNSGTILISNRGEIELNFNLENQNTFKLKKNNEVTTDIAIKVEQRNLVLPPGKSENIEVRLEGTRSDTGAFELSVYATELNPNEEPISATIEFDTVFDPEEISPIEARRCQSETLHRRPKMKLTFITKT